MTIKLPVLPYITIKLQVSPSLQYMTIKFKVLSYIIINLLVVLAYITIKLWFLI